MPNATQIANDARVEAARLLEQANTLAELADVLDPPRPRRRQRRIKPKQSSAPENARAGGASETRLRVLSSTAPTEAELEDRDVAYVTQEGA